MKVEVVESGLLLPSEETPKHSIWLSNLDLVLGYMHHNPTIYVYRPRGDAGDFSTVETMKAALSKVLVPFYPLAGRLAKGPDGRLQISCSGEGVVFAVARSESSIDDLGDFAPSSEMRQLFVPSVSADPPAILLAVQVTFLKGGGVILGTGFYHIAGDGSAMMNFIKSWSDTARGMARLAVPPFVDRTLLRPRSPPAVPFDHIEYTPNADSYPATSPAATAVLMLTETQVALLKRSNNSGGGICRISTFQAVAAFLWRCSCIARGLAPEQETRMYFPVDARSRLNPQLPEGYFGNAICRTSAAAKAEDIVSNSLSHAADMIRCATARVSDEYVRSIIDFLEVRESKGVQTLPATDMAAVSWLRMPVYDADFGWGEPAHVGKASMPAAGFVYIMDSPANDGGVSIALALETENSERFKDVFYNELDRIDA